MQSFRKNANNFGNLFLNTFRGKTYVAYWHRHDVFAFISIPLRFVVGLTIGSLAYVAKTLAQALFMQVYAPDNYRYKKRKIIATRVAAAALFATIAFTAYFAYAQWAQLAQILAFNLPIIGVTSPAIVQGIILLTFITSLVVAIVFLAVKSWSASANKNQYVTVEFGEMQKLPEQERKRSRGSSELRGEVERFLNMVPEGQRQKITKLTAGQDKLDIVYRGIKSAVETEALSILISKYGFEGNVLENAQAWLDTFKETTTRLRNFVYMMNNYRSLGPAEKLTLAQARQEFAEVEGEFIGLISAVKKHTKNKADFNPLAYYTITEFEGNLTLKKESRPKVNPQDLEVGLANIPALPSPSEIVRQEQQSYSDRFYGRLGTGTPLGPGVGFKHTLSLSSHPATPHFNSLPPTPTATRKGAGKYYQAPPAGGQNPLGGLLPARKPVEAPELVDPGKPEDGVGPGSLRSSPELEAQVKEAVMKESPGTDGSRSSASSTKSNRSIGHHSLEGEDGPVNLAATRALVLDLRDVQREADGQKEESPASGSSTLQLSQSSGDDGKRSEGGSPRTSPGGTP